LSGKKQEEPARESGADPKRSTEHEGAVAELGGAPAPAGEAAPPGPPDIPAEEMGGQAEMPEGHIPGVSGGAGVGSSAAGVGAGSGWTDEAHAASPGSPFHPPDAWNTEALTSPKPEASGEKPAIGPVDPAVTAELQPKIVEALKTVYDPEIPVDIYELGLIYGIDADAQGRVLVNMTLTSPACPSAQQLPSEVRYKVKAIPGVADAWVEIVWEPPWDKDRMSEAAKLQLGFF
jgi:FeS assembly SUF system protein